MRQAVSSPVIMIRGIRATITPFEDYALRYLTRTTKLSIICLSPIHYTGTGSQGGGDENDKDGYSVFAEINPIEKIQPHRPLRYV